MSPYRLSRISVAILMIGAFAALLIMATVDARAVRSVSTRSHPVAQRACKWCRADQREVGKGVER